MDYGDYYWGLYRGYYRDPFPHSLLRAAAKQMSDVVREDAGEDAGHIL